MPLTELTHSGDPISQKTIYIYAHLFGYDRAHAVGLGLTPMAEEVWGQSKNLEMSLSVREFG
jgi:hypothetical protein